jgi:PPOX class probable F420-dependent enzyme
MTAELTQEVSTRLADDYHGWLTTVAKSGQPVPKLIWFYFDGAALVVYSMPEAAKLAHIRRHPQVSLNLDSVGNGDGVVVIGGTATIDAEDANPADDEPFWTKYSGTAEQLGITDAIASYSTRIKISIDKVWTTPS